MDNLQNIHTSFVPVTFAYPDDFTGFGDVGCGCANCGGLGDTWVNSKGQTINCTGTRKKPGTCTVVAQPRRGTVITEPKLPVSIYNIRNTDPYSPPIRPGINIYNDQPPPSSNPLYSQATQPGTKGSSWLAKVSDAYLTAQQIKAQRDVAIAQAGGQLPQKPGQLDPRDEAMLRLQSQVSAYENPNSQVANAGAFAGEAAGSAIDGVVGFVTKNPLIVGLVAVGIFLFLKEPPKRGKA